MSTTHYALQRRVCHFRLLRVILLLLVSPITSVLSFHSGASGEGWHILLLGDDLVPYFESTLSSRKNGSVLLYPNTSKNEMFPSTIPMAPAEAVCTTYGEESQSKTTFFVMLKLATSGSTWIGDLLTETKGVTMKPEIITGSRGHRMSVASILFKLKSYFKAESRTTPRNSGSRSLVGFSVNAKNMGSINFPSFAVENRARLVVWIRSNIVSHAVGVIRAKMLHELCHTNNVKLGQAKKCALQDHETIKLDDFWENLRAASFRHAIHMGMAYQNWGLLGTSQKNGEGKLDKEEAPCNSSPPIFNMFYEEMLADKNGALQRLFDWFGYPELLGADEKNAPADKTVKSTPADLRNLISNFDELEEFLLNKAPCYVAQLRSNGKEVMPICPSIVSPATPEGALEVQTELDHLRKKRFPVASGHHSLNSEVPGKKKSLAKIQEFPTKQRGHRSSNSEVPMAKRRAVPRSKIEEQSISSSGEKPGNQRNKSSGIWEFSKQAPATRRPRHVFCYVA